ncbi:hypothetical protein HYH03_001497 [Edaphochlamys debaryana]|uniref:Uncharacterized protein n=1 Tax=Edaphochlamys debaryana TaxID=47281 RepID=A0A835YDJ2_9CHLO|nr:hypothetical protein HYH03_001497 [Edaphochlamys debaryana]|eukprot:KAG2500733.1 hypothetical protein HYH03_001497 [Edaphochlamys debaryana]
MLQSVRGAHAGAARPRQQAKRDVASRALAGAERPPAVRVTKALKEWAPAIDALASGEQTVLFRKGGIKEPTFKPEATSFLLFPTAFHTDQQLLKPGVAERYAQALQLNPKAEKSLTLPCVAEVTGAWTTFNPAVLTATDDLHVWTEQFIETRLKWRAKQPITVLELRTWRLARPLALPVAEEMFGCFSWVDVSGLVEVDMAGAVPVLEAGAFAARQQRLRQALAAVGAEALEL